MQPSSTSEGLPEMPRRHFQAYPSLQIPFSVDIGIRRVPRNGYQKLTVFNFTSENQRH